MTKWWIDPAFDPLQDLENCKHNISLMAPALEEHRDCIRQLVQQNQQSMELIKQDRRMIKSMADEIKMLRLLLEAEKMHSRQPRE
jgi:hypothetical protein